MPEDRFPLADLIGALGRDLREAQQRAKDDDEADLLKVKECSVELGFSWEKKAKNASATTSSASPSLIRRSA